MVTPAINLTCDVEEAFVKDHLLPYHPQTEVDPSIMEQFRRWVTTAGDDARRDVACIDGTVGWFNTLLGVRPSPADWFDGEVTCVAFSSLHII